MWISGRNDSAPTARYGTDPTRLVNVVTGSTSTYTDSDLCEPPGSMTWVAPGYIHDVTIAAAANGLAAGTVVYYSVGMHDTFSDVQSFVVPAAPGGVVDEPYTFLMVACGPGSAGRALCRRVVCVLCFLEGDSDRAC